MSLKLQNYENVITMKIKNVKLLIFQEDIYFRLQ